MTKTRRFSAAFLAVFSLFAASAALAGCDDPLGFDPQLLPDTVTLAAPTSASTLPSAIDLAVLNALRRPELPVDAQSWDLQLRQEGAAFSFAPFPQVGSRRGAGLAPTSEGFDDADSAPRGREDYTRTRVAITVGQTYFVQTRETSNCLTPKYAVIKVLSVDAAAGTATVAVRSNQNCDDERLTF
ncbi:MAG TPA: hypothetical protein VF746_06975 [Longimicrobium sp.]|jgi:hypothetical protein